MSHYLVLLWSEWNCLLFIIRETYYFLSSHFSRIHLPCLSEQVKDLLDPGAVYWMVCLFLFSYYNYVLLTTNCRRKSITNDNGVAL